jgi:hypothetical protein
MISEQSEEIIPESAVMAYQGTSEANALDVVLFKNSFIVKFSRSYNCETLRVDCDDRVVRGRIPIFTFSGDFIRFHDLAFAPRNDIARKANISGNPF